MKPTKKKSINVQLSKDDLKELLIVLKNFMSEEISVRNKRLLLNQHEMDIRIRSLEIVENNHRAEIHKLKQYCDHEDRFESVCYSKWDKNVLGLHYKCIRCGRQRTKTTILLTWREKRTLRKLGVKV